MTDYYGTESGGDAYHTARNNTAWTSADSATKLAALLVASEYIDGKYGEEFCGRRTGLRAVQVREWPRQGIYDERTGEAISATDVPREVEYATYEAALRHIASPGSLLVDVTKGTRISKVAVSGAVSVEYEGIGDLSDMQVSIPAIDRLLSIFLDDDDENPLSVGSERA